MSASKKYLNMFPWEDWHSGNIDWLLDLTGSFDDRLTKVEEKNVEQDQRLDAHDDAIATLREDLTAETTARENADTALQNNINAEATARQNADSALQTNIDNEATARANADATIQGNVTDLTGRVDTLETGLSDEANARATADQALRNDVTGLDNRVTTLEGHSVVANPGGSGITLNTLAVDNVVYSVPQGGGGGGGSTVTINPAGPATGEAEKIDVDGTIWAIPQGVDTTELTTEEYDPTHTYRAGDFCVYNGTLYKAFRQTTGPFELVDWTATNVGDEIVEINDRDVNHIINYDRYGDGSLTATGDVQTIADTEFTLTDDAYYLIVAQLSLDSSNYGSAARDLGCYLRDTTHLTFLDMKKFHVNGSEHAMITQACNFTLTALVRNNNASPCTIRLATRVNSATNKVYGFEWSYSVLKLMNY